MASPHYKNRPVRALEDLLEPFHGACVPRERWRVGAEIERFAVQNDGLAPASYAGPTGIEGLFSTLMARGPWRPHSELPGRPAIELERGETRITLEPGSQVEISSLPAGNLATLEQSLRECEDELRNAAHAVGLRFLRCGFHPFARRDDLGWVPKVRYEIMRSYLPTRGSLAQDMMQRTSTTQINLDFSSEDDAGKKLRVALRLQSLLTALCANSPLVEGEVTQYLSYRARVWEDVDPDRTGALPALWAGGPVFRQYTEYALDVPMFFFKRDDTFVHNTGQTFRDFWQHGYRGERATIDDWYLHLSTLFPLARMKHTIEVRGADTQSEDGVIALAAFWVGLLYDEPTLERAAELAAAITPAELTAFERNVPTQALDAVLLKRPASAWLDELLALASGGLERLGETPANAARMLQPFTERLARRETPAHDILRKLGAPPPGTRLTRERIVAAIPQR